MRTIIPCRRRILVSSIPGWICNCVEEEERRAGKWVGGRGRSLDKMIAAWEYGIVYDWAHL